jgi:SAM-dependent methyltransferase
VSRAFAARLARLAAQRYPAADPYARHFAYGKLKGDPVYAHVLGAGLVTTGAHVLDVGCGQGLLGAFLLAADESGKAPDWPGDWPPPPTRVALCGIEIVPRDVARARAALGSGADIRQGDMRVAPFPPAGVVALIDVLQYVEPEAQDAILARARRSLEGGGVLLLRVADANGSLRFRATELLDRAAVALRGHGFAPLHSRPLARWQGLLQELGFQVQARPMSAGTPFANVLLVARYDPPGTRSTSP